MKSSARKVNLASVDDLFTTEESRQDATLERIQIIPLTELHPFPDHPFSVRDDDDIMKETLDSVKARGILTPAIARPREGDGYELLAGHRRKRACELVGLDTMPVIVRELSRDEAIFIMVDTNIQRENISPIEKAKALKMKLEAMAVYRVERTKDYTVMSNCHLKDTALSLKAKGLLPLILSLPDDWNYSTRGLASICKEGVEAIGNTIKELEKAGYIVRRQLRGENGKLGSVEYTIYERPQISDTPCTDLPCTGFPDTVEPDTDEPDTENQAQLNTR